MDPRVVVIGPQDRRMELCAALVDVEAIVQCDSVDGLPAEVDVVVAGVSVDEQFDVLRAIQDLGDVGAVLVSSDDAHAPELIRAGARDVVRPGDPLRLAAVVEREMNTARLRHEHQEWSARMAHGQRLEAVGQLAAGVAHEINTPVQYIGDNAAFLEEAMQVLTQAVQVDDDDDDQVAWLLEEVGPAIEQIQEGVQRVSHIVAAMREFAHQGSGVREPVSLGRLAQNTVDVTRGRWKDIAAVSVDVDPDLPLVDAMRADVNQVLVNLVVNACDAIQERIDAGDYHEGTLVFTTRRVGEFAELELRDNGCGMPDEVRARIFEPFYTTKEVGRGTGQGLALAYKTIVKEHHGELHVDSEVGTGSRFRLRLPLVAREAA